MVGSRPRLGRALLVFIAGCLSGEVICVPDVCQDGTGPGGVGQRCNCWQWLGDLLYVDCARRALTEIPSIPENTGVLDLTNNSIPLIRMEEFSRLDTLEMLELAGNPLYCDCSLIDFKNWLINRQTVSALSGRVLDAVCGDNTYSGKAVLDAKFCLGTYQCYQCSQVTSNDQCPEPGPTCFPKLACQNEVTYGADGSASITKTCAEPSDCLNAALFNEAECRQTDGATSRCVYCCQGNQCNQDLNTIDDSYTFPFRRPLAVTTEVPRTSDISLSTLVSDSTEETTPTDDGSRSTEVLSTTETSRTENSTTSFPTDDGLRSTELFPTPETSRTENPTTSFPTDDGLRSTELFPTTHTSRTENTTSFPTDDGLRSTELFPTTETSRTENPTTSFQTVDGLQSTEFFPKSETPWTEQPLRTATERFTSRTQQPGTSVRSSTSATLGAGPRCPAGVTESLEGVITWPEMGVNLTAVVPCPYTSPQDQEIAHYASRSCTWNATIGRAVWTEPDVDECSSASDILAALAHSDVTGENMLEVSDQLRLVTSHQAALKGSDVTNAVDVLTSLLSTISRHPRKGRKVFGSAIAVAGQMTSVSFKELLLSQAMNRSVSRLVQLIDEFALNVNLLSSSNVTAESRELDVIILDTDEHPINGLVFGGRRGVNDDDARPFVVSNESVPENVTSIVGSVRLPFNLVHSLGVELNRVQFTLYQSTDYFDVITSSVEHPAGNLATAAEGALMMLNSAVVSASLGNLSVVDLTEPAVIRLEIRNRTVAYTNPQCVFWNTEANDKQGGWSTDGCVLNVDLSDSTTVVCECYHLTNFAMLMDVYNYGMPEDPVHVQVLDIITYVGCSLSIVALILAVITLACCKEKSKYQADKSGSQTTNAGSKVRTNRHTTILLHLSSGLILADAFFLFNAVTVELGLGPRACVGVAVATHFSLLAALSWMALEAFNMYLALVLVFDKYFARLTLKMCLFGWGVPFAIVATTFFINFPDNYGQFNGICWLDRVPFLASFLAPVCTVLLFNSVVFLAVTWQLCKMRRRNLSQSRHGFDLAAQFKASVSITFLFGLTWGFAFFGIGEASLAFSYLFAIFNSAQGFNIFVFQCLLKPGIRRRWMRMLGRQDDTITTSRRPSSVQDSKNVQMLGMSGTDSSQTTSNEPVAQEQEQRGECSRAPSVS